MQNALTSLRKFARTFLRTVSHKFTGDVDRGIVVKYHYRDVVGLQSVIEAQFVFGQPHFTLLILAIPHLLFEGLTYKTHNVGQLFWFAHHHLNVAIAPAAYIGNILG